MKKVILRMGASTGGGMDWGGREAEYHC